MKVLERIKQKSQIHVVFSWDVEELMVLINCFYCWEKIENYWTFFGLWKDIKNAIKTKNLYQKKPGNNLYRAWIIILLKHNIIALFLYILEFD